MERKDCDVLVIAGTTESRRVIERLVCEGKKVLAAVATQLGREMLADYPVEVSVGRLDVDGFVGLMRERRPGRVLDASHPFARIVTETVKEACRITGIPYERREREGAAYDYDGIVWAEDAPEAARLARGFEGNILLTTGANTAGVYAAEIADYKKRVYIRVLDHEKSREGCSKAGYPPSHVIGQMPPFSVEDNRQLLRKLHISVMVSKDSGASGGVPEKVEACRLEKIPLILIRRPENKVDIPRIAIAGANSGCGKTTVTCGILRALWDRGMDLQPFKCGPDYIDPMLHSHITGKSCRNLDPFFLEEGDLLDIFVKDGQKGEFSVIEGVMGYYDGMGMSCEKSTYTVTMATKTPTVLVLNAKGMSYTMLPVLEGLIKYKENPIKAVILNRCTKGMFALAKPAIERELGIEAVGYLPPSEEIVIGSRHLGLMTAGEIANLDQVTEAAGKLAAETIDLDRLLAIGREAPELPVRPAGRKMPLRKAADPAAAPKGASDREDASKPVIAVAQDKAFCFYYEENLEALRELGARLAFFSPVEDPGLPPETAGIYLGGGYPEAYAGQLSANEGMKRSIRLAVEEGIPMIAECGGFMYVCRRLVDGEGGVYPMAGLVDTDVEMTKKLNLQFGYVTLDAREDNAFVGRGQRIRAHEFHYSRAEDAGGAFSIQKQNGKKWNGVHVKGNVWAGYPHLYFRNCMEVAENFVAMARKHSWEKRGMPGDHGKTGMDGQEKQDKGEEREYGKEVER